VVPTIAPLWLRKILLLVASLALMAGACTNEPSPPTDTPSSSNAPSITTLPAPTTTSAIGPPTTTLLPPAPTTIPSEGLAADVEVLIGQAEEMRGLGFVTKPEVILLDAAQFASSVADAEIKASEDRDNARTAIFHLIGQIDEAKDLQNLRADLVDKPEFAWYDPTSGSLLVAASPQGFGPLARSEIVHEIVHAITDQHYRWWAVRQSLVLAGADDRLAALDALIEGDATYFQVVYNQGLSASERDEIAREFNTPSSPTADDWVLEDFAFPFDEGFEFVSRLVVVGGIAAVDRAYLDPPLSTEHVLHPARYKSGEAPLDAGALEASIGSYIGLPAASLGEWNLRLVLAPAVSPGLLTQTADGWGGDTYRVYISGNGGTAVALSYVGDSEADALEVTEAFIALAEDVLRLGAGERSWGGLVYSRSGRPWMFIDREKSGLLVVVASSAGAGRELADQLSPPEGAD
jgi:hypothetical protein